MAVRVLLNCAVSGDGHLAGPDGQPVRLSDEEDWRRVQAMRAACDAILVGAGTVRNDDPSLRVDPELAQGDDPLRVVLDTHARLDAGRRVFDGSAGTVVAHVDGTPPPGVDAIRVPAGRHGIDLEVFLDRLASRGVRTLLVEGGAKVLAAFLEEGCWDEWTVYEAPIHLGSGPALPRPAQLRAWGVHETTRIARGDGWLKVYGRE